MANETKPTRKLRAILSADVKGYSLLMADDEAFTIQTIKKYRNIISSCVEQHTGRVVDSPGDNILAEFASAVDAVQCAVEIQKQLKKENDRLVEDKRLKFRIGINIGDVVHDGDRIYGDGVNIAARIEGLADPGGVCISRSAYNQIKKKVGFEYAYLGEQSLKNIDDPVNVYKILMMPVDAGKPVDDKRKSSKAKWIVALAAVTAIIIFIIVWQLFDKKTTVVKEEAVQKLAPVSSEKPSIAVLPFINMSNDPEQNFFADGMTDELISDLAKIKDILVISRNSAFTYKGKAIKIQQVAQELNVRYILEGSVQRAGNKVRIRAQLIDGRTDHHIWSESYDSVMDDIFELQDKITEKIVSALSVTLTTDEQDRISDKGTNSIPAYEAYLKGFEHYSRMTGDNLIKAIKYYREATKIDPSFSRAYSGLAAAYYMSTSFNFPKEFEFVNLWEFITFRYKARHYLNLSMKNPTWEAYTIAAYMDIMRKRFDEAVSFAERAVFMAPNEYLANIAMGHVLNCVGRADEALKFLDKAMRLDPRFLDILLVEKGKALFILGDYEKAVESIQSGLTLNPALTNYSSFEAASHAFLGKEKEAKNAWAKFVDGFPFKSNLTTRYLYYFFSFKDHKVFDRFIDGIKKAGFSGNPSDYYKVEKKNKLSGLEIRELLFGKTAIAGNAPGSEFSFEWSTVGDVVLRNTRA